MTINSKFKGLSAAAAAVSLFAITPARSGPVLPDRLELSTWRAPVEPAGYHWQRHYHQAYAADDYAAEELAMTALFWPLWSSDCCFGGCGWTVATDPGCYFYGCGAGWGLGPFAWGLFGLGFADPYGISGWGYSGLGYGEFGYPGFGGYGGVAGARFGAGLGAGLGTGVLAGRHFAGHHIGRGAHGFGAAPFRRLARSPRPPFRRLSQLWRPSFRRLSRFRRPPFHGVPRRRLRRRLPWRRIRGLSWRRLPRRRLPWRGISRRRPPLVPVCSHLAALRPDDGDAGSKATRDRNGNMIWLCLTGDWCNHGRLRTTRPAAIPLKTMSSFRAARVGLIG